MTSEVHSIPDLGINQLQILSQQNLSCFLYGAGDARFETTSVPVIEDPYDVLIQIAFTGVCGSDVRTMTSHLSSISDSKQLLISGF